MGIFAPRRRGDQELSNKPTFHHWDGADTDMDNSFGSCTSHNLSGSEHKLVGSSLRSCYWIYL